MQSYAAFGLQITADLPLPELIPVQEDQSDLYIVRKAFELPANMEEANCFRQDIQARIGFAEREEVYLYWKNIAAFKAVGGNQLYYDPETDDPSLFRLYLLSEALGILLFQKDYFLLHASCVEVNGRAIVFLGTPGAGKSSMVAACSRKGYRVLSDDLVAITFNEHQQPAVLPAFPQIKIWESAVRGLGFPKDTVYPLFKGSRKYILRKEEGFPQSPVSLEKIIVIQKKSTLPRMKQITGPDAFLNLTRYFALPHQLLKGKKLETHFTQASMIMQYTGMWELSRPPGFEALLDFAGSLGNERLPCA